MPQNDQQSLAEILKNALAKPTGVGGDLALTAALSGKHPAEIVNAMDKLSLPETLAVFNWLDNERAAEVLDELDPQTVRYITDNAPARRIAELLDHLPMDDAAEVVSESAPERVDSMLADLQQLAPDDANEVRTLLSFPEGSAGRLMTNMFASVFTRDTAEIAMNYIKTHADRLETINEIYVLDDDAKLVGVMPVKRLITASPSTTVREIMTPDPVSVSPQTDQRQAAMLISRYDMLTLPVSDTHGHLIGIVTIDDMIDVLVEEFTDDYLKTVGSDAEELERKTPAQIAKLRMPWIMATMFIELMAGVVIHVFDATLTKFILLASFMPIISAISGNTGLQSAAIIIRGLSSGQVQLDHWKTALTRQMTTTLLLSLACASSPRSDRVGLGSALRFRARRLFGNVHCREYRGDCGDMRSAAVEARGLRPRSNSGAIRNCIPRRDRYLNLPEFGNCAIEMAGVVI